MLAHVGLPLGYLGTALLMLSFGYSLRKRGQIKRGRPARWLILHEWLAGLGMVLILIHGGIHQNALLPWLALGAMLIATASGLIGRYLLRKAQRLAKENPSLTASLTVAAMKKWRVIHLPITVICIVLALSHIFSIFYFWRW